MSVIATRVLSILNDLFPANPYKRVIKEHYVNYKGVKLFFDFYIKELSVLVEVQGRQHVEFVKHFHSDKSGFEKQKRRDNMKLSYTQTNSLCLVRFYYDEDITEELVLKKINKAMEDGFCD